MPDTPAHIEPVRARLGVAPLLVGRDHELQVALGLLDGAGPRALILAGEPGIGKTTLWRELMRWGGERDFEVLTAMPSGAEVQLTFAALGDLIDGLGQGALVPLAPPLRRALGVALLQVDGAAVDARAVGVALLALLRARAARRPLLIGIDDLQWLDGASARALEFALRRLGDAPVAVAATLRIGEHEGVSTLDLPAALGSGRVGRLEIGPLTLAAIHELLVARIGVELPRRTLVALFDAAGGNPFLAVELAQEHLRRGAEFDPGSALAVPASVRALVSARVERLPPETRQLLLAAGGLARPTLELIGRLCPDAEAVLQPAVRAGLIELGPRPGEVRFTHPLHARVPYEALDADRRRRLHAGLSAVVDDVEERARHQALAAPRPSTAVAAALDRGAHAAAARGALARAAELCLLGARLTPARDGQRRGLRTLAAAQWLHRAGDSEQAGVLAAGVMASPAAGGDTRARAMAALAAARSDTAGVAAARDLYERARREPGACAETRAEIHRRIAWLCLSSGGTAAAERHARAGLRLATGRYPVVEAGAAAIAGLAGVVGGARLDEELLTRTGPSAPAAATSLDQWSETTPEFVAAVTLLWVGELERARPVIEAALQTAVEREETTLAMHARAYLSSIATGLGELTLALTHAEDYLELADEAGQEAQRGAALWPVAVAAAWLGEEERARAAAQDGLAIARDSGYRLYEIGCLGALGLLELSLERPAAAVDALARGRELAATFGVRAMGRISLLPESVEALVLVGEIQTATELARELDRRAQRLGSPWALALARRCEGLLAEAAGEPDRAIASFRSALGEYARQDRPPERARTQLMLGRVLRRARQKRAARQALEDAVAGFEHIGARLWALSARRELGRIGGRAASPAGQLSGTERSIAGLVAAGRTNHEVGQALHLSARTVEWNLSKIYRKLGVRGRTELAAVLMPELGAATLEHAHRSPAPAPKPGVSPG